MSLLQLTWAPVTGGVKTKRMTTYHEISENAPFCWEAKGQLKKESDCCLIQTTDFKS